jgi:hypothetical protein
MHLFKHKGTKARKDHSRFEIQYLNLKQTTKRTLLNYNLYGYLNVFLYNKIGKKKETNPFSLNVHKPKLKNKPTNLQKSVDK